MDGLGRLALAGTRANGLVCLYGRSSFLRRQFLFGRRAGVLLCGFSRRWLALIGLAAIDQADKFARYLSNGRRCFD